MRFWLRIRKCQAAIRRPFRLNSPILPEHPERKRARERERERQTERERERERERHREKARERDPPLDKDIQSLVGVTCRNALDKVAGCTEAQKALQDNQLKTKVECQNPYERQQCQVSNPDLDFSGPLHRLQLPRARTRTRWQHLYLEVHGA